MAEEGPGDLDFYKDEISKLFSESDDEDRPPRSFFAAQVPDHSSAGRRVKSKTDGASKASGPLFSGGLGQELTEVNRERLNWFLERSVEELDEQFQQLYECVLAVRQIRRHLTDEAQSSRHSSSRDEDGDSFSGRKNVPPTVADAIQTLVGTIESESYEELRRDFQETLESGGLQAELALRQYSSDLCTKLRSIAEQVDEYLNTLLSKCRNMNLAEKQQLRQRIQKLSGKSLDGVAEIVKHQKPPAEKNSENIYVELNEEDTSTLWRLHYFVKLIETVNKLSLG